MANEAFAALRSWDRCLRRMKRIFPARWELLRGCVPHRRRLKVNLHRNLFRLRGRTLDITLHRDRHVSIDLSGIRNPLFEKYGEASGWKFGLAITDEALIFQFRIPEYKIVLRQSAGVDLNMPSADFATSDGVVGSVDLRRVTAIQGAMARKRAAIARHINKDLRHQRAVMRRYRGRERHRVEPLLHEATNELLESVGNKNLIFEDLATTPEQLIRESKRRPFHARRCEDSDARRRLSSWTQGEFQRIVRYKSATHVVRVNPRGTSSECPKCGGLLAHPSWRRATCRHCQEVWHRDRAAAMVILSRGQDLLRGAAPPPSARNALLEAARWRPADESSAGLIGEPVKGDDANARRDGLPSRLKEE